MPKYLQDKLEPTGASKTVTTAGTAERLVAASVKVPWFSVAAKSGNTNPVYVGDSNVDSTTSPQMPLATAGNRETLQAPEGCYFDLYDWWVDVTTDGEGVDLLYVR